MPDRNLYKPRLAREIMITNLVTLRPQTPVLDGIRSLLQSNIKGAPVTDPDRTYHGIFTERCCLNVLMTYAGNASWSEYFGGRAPTGADIMTRTLPLLTPEMDVFETINLLLANRISGAPVVDRNGCFLGVFSERSSMNVLIGAAYDSLPTTQIEMFMNTDRNCTIEESLDLQSIVKRFLETPYRQLPVLRADRVVGRISRKDVLHAMQGMVDQLETSDREALPQTTETFMDTEAGTIVGDIDIFSVANIFRESGHRRLSVVANGRLSGLITRKNLLWAANELLKPAAVKKAQPLYLNSVADARPPET